MSGLVLRIPSQLQFDSNSYTETLMLSCVDQVYEYHIVHEVII